MVYAEQTVNVPVSANILSCIGPNMTLVQVPRGFECATDSNGVVTFRKSPGVDKH